MSTHSDNNTIITKKGIPRNKLDKILLKRPSLRISIPIIEVAHQEDIGNIELTESVTETVNGTQKNLIENCKMNSTNKPHVTFKPTNITHNQMEIKSTYTPFHIQNDCVIDPVNKPNITTQNYKDQQFSQESTSQEDVCHTIHINIAESVRGVSPTEYETISDDDDVVDSIPGKDQCKDHNMTEKTSNGKFHFIDPKQNLLSMLAFETQNSAKTKVPIGSHKKTVAAKDILQPITKDLASKSFIDNGCIDVLDLSKHNTENINRTKINGPPQKSNRIQNAQETTKDFLEQRELDHVNKHKLSDVKLQKKLQTQCTVQSQRNVENIPKPLQKVENQNPYFTESESRLIQFLRQKEINPEDIITFVTLKLKDMKKDNGNKSLPSSNDNVKSNINKDINDNDNDIIEITDVGIPPPIQEIIKQSDRNKAMLKAAAALNLHTYVNAESLNLPGQEPSNGDTTIQPTNNTSREKSLKINMQKTKQINKKSSTPVNYRRPMPPPNVIPGYYQSMHRFQDTNFMQSYPSSYSNASCKSSKPPLNRHAPETMTMYAADNEYLNYNQVPRQQQQQREAMPYYYQGHHLPYEPINNSSNLAQNPVFYRSFSE